MYDCTHRRKPLFWVHKFHQWWWRESIRITRGSPTMDCTPTSLYLKTIYCSYILSWIVILIRFSSKSQCPCHIQCLGRRSQGLCVRTVATPQPIWTVRIETGDAQFDPKKNGQLQDLSNILSHGLSKFSTQLVSHPWTDELRQFYRAHSSDTNVVKTPTSGREANWMLQIQLFLFFLIKHTQICHIVKRHEWLAQRTLTARWEGSRGCEIKSRPGRRWSSNIANFPVLYVYLIFHYVLVYVNLRVTAMFMFIN